MASPFSLEGRLKLDARDFTKGADKAKRAVGEIGDEFGKLPKDADAAASKASKNVSAEMGKLPKDAKRAVDEIGGEFEKLPKDAKRAVDEIGGEFEKLPKDADAAASKASKNVSGELGKLPGKAKRAVDGMGDEFGKLPKDADAAASKASKNVSGELGKLPKEADGIGGKIGGNLGGSMIAGFGALGVGAVLLSSLMEGLETQKAVAKVNNAFRRTPEEAARQGKIAGEMYANNWGEGLGDLENKVALTNQRIKGLTDEQLSQIATGATAIADTFDQDFEAIVRSAGQLLENDLAPTAEAALDIITTGFQDGADEAEDWLDTIDEYAQHFEAVGLSAADMASMVTTGLQNGQRDSSTCSPTSS